MNSNIVMFPMNRTSAMKQSHAARRRIHDFLSMSEEILALAEACDWSSALTLQEVRRQELEAWFADRPAMPDNQELIGVINQLLALDARITDKLHAQRQQLLVDANASRQSHRQVNAYLQS
jgi:hypothetical protein